MTSVLVESPVDTSPLCLLGDFDAQVEEILSKELRRSENIVAISTRFEEFKQIIQRRWPGAKLHVYGSIPSGLGLKSSDLDIYIDIPNYNKSKSKIVQETAKIFYQDPKKYSRFLLVNDKVRHRFSFYNKLVKLYTHVTFDAYDGVDNTKIVAYYLNLDERNTPLAVLVKIWSQIHQLSGKDLFPNYVFYLMTIFYLQQKNMAPTGFQIQENSPPRIVNKWNANYNEISFQIDNRESLYELLGGLFEYYSEFNFKDNCISPYAGRPIPRADLININTIPDEFVLYKNCLKSGDCRPLSIDSDMCVQDIIEHNSNCAERAGSETVAKLIEHLRLNIKIYQTLAIDRFLGAILYKDFESVAVGKTN